MINFDYVRKNVHTKYDEEYLKKILLQFCEQPLDNKNFNIENRNISKVLSYFFEDLIYDAKSKNGKYSPNEILKDDYLLEMAFKYIHEHPSFYHNKSDITNLKDFFFSSSMCGKVTIFNPVIARKIYEYYLPQQNATIFDYSCGFGSRMLGALTSPNNYYYIGVDPYKELYNRLLSLSIWIADTRNENSRTTIINTGSEQFLHSLNGKIDLSFSSPPYFNYEIYTSEKTQSYIMYPTYDEWIQNYVLPTIQNIYNYTKSNGIHIVNLENTKKIKIIDDWLNIALDVGFKLEEIREISTLQRSSAKNKNKLLVMKK